MSNYSDIISAENYNNLMSKEHLYISTSDLYIAKVIADRAKDNMLEVVEVGCGPARITGLVGQAEGINLTGVDVDGSYIKYAQEKLKGRNIKVVNHDVCTYKHGTPVDIFYSQGFHHHMPKGKIAKSYLKNVYSCLKPGGVYIIGDEFVPEYSSAAEREERLVVWYSHVIAHALKNNYTYLAEEEAKTLLDDLYEGRTEESLKSKQQIDFILSRVTDIDSAARASNESEVEKLVHDCLSGLAHFVGDADAIKEMVLSRGDYKVCDSAFRKEIEDVGFKVLSARSFGPISNIGAMVVYVLEK